MGSVEGSGKDLLCRLVPIQSWLLLQSSKMGDGAARCLQFQKDTKISSAREVWFETFQVYWAPCIHASSGQSSSVQFLVARGRKMAGL